MRPFNFDEIKESGTAIAAGNYVCKVVEAADFTDKEYVKLGMEVADGTERGYRFDYYVSYKVEAAGMLKARLHAFADSNPGFLTEPAWNAGQLPLFLGKRVGVCFNEEEWRGNDGEVRCSAKAGDMLDAAKVKDGTAKPARRKGVDGKWRALGEMSPEMAAQQSPAQPYRYQTGAQQVQADDYIPFV